MMAANARATVLPVSCPDIRAVDAYVQFTIPTVDPSVDPTTITGVTIDFSNLVINGQIYVTKDSGEFPHNINASLGITTLGFSDASGTLVGNVDFVGDPNADTIAVTNSLLPKHSAANTTIVAGTWVGDNQYQIDLASFATQYNPGDTVKLYLFVDNISYNGTGSGAIDWKANLSGSVNVNFTTVPELATFGVLGLGSVALMLLRRK